MKSAGLELPALSGRDHGSLEDRFWRGVLKSDGCWEWQRYCDPETGYGRIADRDGYTKIGTHRASWIIHFGYIPDGLWVLHKCDNRKCVRPDHLFLGTCNDNNHDMWQKGRGHKPPARYGGRTEEQRRNANKIRMGKGKTHCRRDHPLPEYQPGKTRKCMHEDCRGARRFNALGGKR